MGRRCGAGDRDIVNLRNTLCAILAALAAGLASGTPSAAAAVPWTSAFAADSDRVLFMAADGGLWRAPFDLAARETLWAPSAAARVVRVRVSPDGRGAAWITRAARDSAQLWAMHDAPPHHLATFVPLDPSTYNIVHREAALPSVEDRDVRGARFLQPDARMHQSASIAFDWTPDSRLVVFGHADGVAAASVDNDSAGPFPVSSALALRLDALAPAPMFDLQSIVLRANSGTTEVFRSADQPVVDPSLPPGVAPDFSYEDPGHRSSYGGPTASRVTRGQHPEPARYLLYPLPHRWRVFAGPDLAPATPSVATASGLWWASGDHVHAVRSDDPRDRVAGRTGGLVRWIGWDVTHGQVLWVDANGLRAVSESGGDVQKLVTPSGGVRAAVGTRDGRWVAMVGDQLVLWDVMAARAVTMNWHGGEAAGLFSTDAGAIVLVTRAPDSAPRLVRVDVARGVAEAVETPRVPHGVVAQSPGGGALLLFDPAPRAPGQLHVYDIGGARWMDVENPGIIGWEPLIARGE